MKKIYFLQQLLISFIPFLKRFRGFVGLTAIFSTNAEGNTILSNKIISYASMKPIWAAACFVGFQQDVGIVSRGSPILRRKQ